MTTNDRDTDQKYVTALEELRGLGVIESWAGPNREGLDDRSWEVQSSDGTQTRLSPEMLWAFIEGARASLLALPQGLKPKRAAPSPHRRV
jgi:hypothetical protein